MANYRKYSKDFKLQTAKLITEQGYLYDQAAKRLGTTGRSGRNWIQKFQKTQNIHIQTEAPKSLFSWFL